MPPRPKKFERNNTSNMTRPSKNFSSNQVDKSLLQKDKTLDEQKLQNTLDFMKKNFFSCPMVDEPDPQEK